MKRKREENGGDDRKKKKKKSNVMKKVKERQRRGRISESISELKKLVPTCQQHKKLNQSLIMSLSVDYIQYLQKKVDRLEKINMALQQGRSIDENELPYVPDQPENKFTDYQKQKDCEFDVQNELALEKDDSMDEASSPSNRGIPSVSDMADMMGQYMTYNNSSVMNSWNEPPPAENFTIGNLISQIPNYGNRSSSMDGLPVPMPMPQLPGKVDERTNGLNLMPSLPGVSELPMANSISMHDRYRNSSENNYNHEADRNYQMMKRDTQMGNMPMFRSQNQGNNHGNSNHQRAIDMEQMDYQNMSNFGNMGDIEDFGSWPLHPTVSRSEAAANQSQRSFLGLPDFPF
eukprot:TRINITY_DN5001_c0_g1_i1.p1 TRINITY_DN5001_c0_g1~~TRINITY_DN5001_c0_g1_i1.p1  ORF type:complete len:361 (+),score=90.07 TRINITY_DN5001_c0_g1_i1:48-1085(+)